MGRLYRGCKVLNPRGGLVLGLVLCACAAGAREPLCPESAVGGEPLEIRAGEARWQSRGPLELTGGVEVRYGDGAVLRAGTLTHRGGRTFAPGSVEFHGRRFRLQGTDLEHTADVTRMRKALFTPCPQWSLAAGRLELDHAAGRGRAWNTALRILELPVLWLPYLNFPLDDRRKSGFLYPRVGVSDRSGVEFSLPYYWNLAPHRDLTLTLRSFSRRGVAPAVEYRYLHPTGGGRLYAEALPADARKDSRFRGRVMAGLRHRLASLEFSVEAERATDRAYFSDLSDRLEDSSARYLEQRAELRYRRGAAAAWLRLAEFQSLSGDAPPHGRVPEFGLELAAGRQLRSAFGGRLARFTGTGADGLRLDLHSRVSWEARAGWGFFVPRAGIRYTAYRLDAGASPRGVALPVLELDAGLYLERPLRAGRLLHVLEPRLQYRQVPFRDQSDRPLYDTAELEYSARAPFLPDRHTGADRIGDTRRLALTVRTGLHGEGGVEWGHFTLGRVYFLRARRVQRDGGDPPAERASPWLQALELNGPGKLGMSQELHFNPKGGISRLAVSAHYRPDTRLELEAGWRARRGADRPRQGVLRLRWDPHPAWGLQGRVRHTADPGRLLEAMAGVEYRSCCWSVRLGAGRHLSAGAGAGYNTQVYAEFGLRAGFRAGGGP